MSYSPTIEVDSVSKSYKMYNKSSDRLKQFFFKNKKLYSEFWALKDVSFEVFKGQTVGILGKNGSGKSTLLQIITQTLQPTSGTAKVHGRVAALLELGSGFNPEFTGRENVYLNGSIMGLTRAEIEERMSSIEDFAEIGKFIDQPVKVYSSGMFVRLAFACAVNVDPDILIIDEALAVGDMQFQLKCMEKMKSFQKMGKTILFVSHDTYSIKNFCNEAIWMKNGEIYMRGDVQRVAELYEDYMKNGVRNEFEEVEEERTNYLNNILSIDNLEFFNDKNQRVNNIRSGGKLVTEVTFTIHQKFEGIVGGVAIIDSNKSYICGLNTKLDRYELPSEPGTYRLHCVYETLDLLPGTYFVDIGFFESSGVVRLDYKSKFNSFTVSSEKYLAEGIYYLKHNWDVKD